MSVNKVILIGNVGKDPQVRYIAENKPYASFPLATSDPAYTTEAGVQIPERTEWHNIVAWRNSADVAEKYIRKGTQLYIEGKLRTRSWTDQTGNKRYTTEITVDNLQLLGRKSDNPGAQDGGQAQGGYNAGQGQQGGYQQVQGYGQPALRQAQGPVNGAAQGPVGNAAQGPAYAQPQYQQGGYQPVRQPTPQPVQQPGFQQQPIQQPQQQAPVNPIEVAAADMPQDDLPF